MPQVPPPRAARDPVDFWERLQEETRQPPPHLSRRQDAVVRSFIRGDIGKEQASVALDREWQRRRYQVAKVGQYRLVSPKSAIPPRSQTPMAVAQQGKRKPLLTHLMEVERKGR